MLKVVCDLVKSILVQPTGRRALTISKGQLECARVLKKLFPRHEFKTMRPDFLKNPKTRRNLELDLYCPELQLAVEYNGAQHYVFTPMYHASPAKFEEQVYRDKLKRRLCKKHNVKLIVVPYSVGDIEEFIRKELSRTDHRGSWCVIV